MIHLTVKGAVVATGLYAYSKLTNKTKEEVAASASADSLTESSPEQKPADPFASREFGAPMRGKKGDVRSLTASH